MKTSVIIPAYNAGGYISNMLDAVLKQTYSDFEIIVIDDGSTDNTTEIIKGYSECDRRIQLLSQENSGPSRARNSGIAESHGEYIVFADSDDLIPDNYLYELVSCIEANNADMAICGRITKYASGDVETSAPSQTLTAGDFIAESLIGNITPLIAFTGPVNRIFRKDIIVSNNLAFDTSYKYGEDTLFDVQYIKYCHTVSVTDKTRYICCDRGGSLSKSFAEGKFGFYRPMKNCMDEIFEIHNIDKRVRFNLACYFVDSFFVRAREILATEYIKEWKCAQLTFLIESGIVTEDDIRTARGNKFVWKMLCLAVRSKSGEALLLWFIAAPKIGG